jgi:hypothetical protein
MTIEEFAEAHRLRLTKDACGDPVIVGRIGASNIYEYSSDGQTLGVMFVGQESRTNLWKKFKAACLEAGMVLRQSAESEGSFSFQPANRKMAKVALKGIRARVKRQISPEQAQAGAARLAAARAARQAVEASI